jgi:histidinol-phosphate aminotransferase
MSYFRKNVEDLAAYQPGEQPPAGAKVIKLNTNENPYPPSPEAMKVLAAVDGEILRRYPDPFARRACEAAAGVYRVPVDHVMAGNGSDELLAIIFRAALTAGTVVAYPMPTYVLYRTLAQMQETGITEVPYDEDYNLPTGALVKAGAAVTVVASPNSPSGTPASNEEIASLASAVKGLVVVDEAYADFADGNALSLVDKFDNVIVLRTLSKGYSLAGLRLGFAVAQPRVIGMLEKIRDSYNIDALTNLVGAAAMGDQAHMLANAERVKASRLTLSRRLKELGFRVWPSQSNFILARPPRGDAERIYQALKQRGILVRYFRQHRLDDKLRITVGTDQQNLVLTGALEELLQGR